MILRFLRRRLGLGSKSEPTAGFSPRCALCARPAARIGLSGGAGSWRLVYSGPGGSNGSGDPISPERAEAIRAAFTPPFDARKIEAAGFHDGAGFCAACGKFYCPDHWAVSPTGGGRCPAGHFKSLDPHWSPD